MKNKSLTSAHLLVNKRQTCRSWMALGIHCCIIKSAEMMIKLKTEAHQSFISRHAFFLLITASAWGVVNRGCCLTGQLYLAYPVFMRCLSGLRCSRDRIIRMTTSNIIGCLQHCNNNNTHILFLWAVIISRREAEFQQQTCEPVVLLENGAGSPWTTFAWGERGKKTHHHPVF